MLGLNKVKMEDKTRDDIEYFIKAEVDCGLYRIALISQKVDGPHVVNDNVAGIGDEITKKILDKVDSCLLELKLRTHKTYGDGEIRGQIKAHKGFPYEKHKDKDLEELLVCFLKHKKQWDKKANSPHKYVNTFISRHWYGLQRRKLGKV